MSFQYGTSRSVNAPCKDCTDRKIGCHSECKAYQDYNAIREMIRKKKRTAIDLYEIQRRRKRD